MLAEARGGIAGLNGRAAVTAWLLDKQVILLVTTARFDERDCRSLIIGEGVILVGCYFVIFFVIYDPVADGY